MDPITAFGLAASILQVVDLSSKALLKCRGLYKDGSLAENRSTEHITRCLADTTNRLRASVDRTPKPLLQSDSEILDLSLRCSGTAAQLLEELEKLKTYSRGNFRQAISKSVRAIRRKAFVKEVQNKLERYQAILDTRILVGLNTHSVEQTSGLERIDQSVQDLLTALNQGRNTVAQLFSNQGQATRDHIDRRFDIYAHADRDDKAQQRFLESLCFPEIFSRQDQIRSVHEGTCRWIFEEPSPNVRKQIWPSFIDWLRHGDSIYWLNGKPGSGKSSLMKYITRGLLDNDSSRCAINAWANGSDFVVSSFFFWRAGGDALQNNLEGLLRSILFQIAGQRQDLIRMIMNVRRNPTGNGLDSWTKDRLFATLQRLLEAESTSIGFLFFIDGLDEFVGDEDELMDLVRCLHTPKTKVCVSSRPEQIFRQGFLKSPAIRLQDFNADDIEKAATDNLSLVLTDLFPRNENAIQQLIQGVIYKAEGVFQWLDLVMKELKRGARNADSLKELEHRLEDIPSTIEGLYEHLFSKLDPLYLQEAVRYFSLLMVGLEMSSFPQSTLLHLICAESEHWDRILANDMMYFSSMEFYKYCQRYETRLLTRCAGLVEIEQQANEFLPSAPLSDELDKISASFVRTNQEGRNVSSHLRSVKFIHRTVVDFLRHQSLFENSDWREAAKLDILHGHLGTVSLVPLAFSAEETSIHGSRVVSMTTVQILMHNICVMSASGAAAEQKQPLKLAMIESVGQAFDIFERVDARLNSSDKRWYTRYTGSSFGVFDFRTVPFPFHDVCGFAAFFGCHTYISHYELRQNRPLDQLDYLFRCANLGLARWAFSDANIQALTVQKLLVQGANPNAPLKFSHHWRFTYFHYTTSAWQSCIRVILRREYIYGDIHTSPGAWKTLIDSFVSHRADINTILTKFICVDENILFIVEESLLSYLERMQDQLESVTLVPLFHLVQSRGAIKQRRFMNIASYMNNSEGTIDLCLLYRVSKDQSDRLCEEWPEHDGGSERDKASLSAIFRDIEPDLVKEIDLRENSIHEIYQANNE